MSTLRNLLTFAYKRLPDRCNVEDYVILPTGDGAAVCVMKPPNPEDVAAANNNAAAAPAPAADTIDIIDDDATADSFDSPEEAMEKQGYERTKQLLQNQENRTPKKCTCTKRTLRTIEETALWIGSSLLLWAQHRDIGLRVGLNSGELSIVEDPYGAPNVCGDAINMAARIMDTAMPGQILLCSTSVVPKLNLLLMGDRLKDRVRGNSISGEGLLEDDEASIANDEMAERRTNTTTSRQCATQEEECRTCPHMKYLISSEPSEVVVKHGVTTTVQSVTCTLYSLPQFHDLPLDAQLELEIIQQQQEFRRAEKDAQNPQSEPSLEQQQQQQQKQPSESSSLPQPSPSHQPNHQQQQTKPIGHHEQHSTPLDLPFLAYQVGVHDTPKTKWYMKIMPTEMDSVKGQIKPKVLPQELIRRHRRIAFLGIMHDNLSKAFIKVMEDDPQHTWDQVYILFPSDECIAQSSAINFPKQPSDKISHNRNVCQQNLLKLLSPKVHDLRFLQYNQLMHCGSYWDWSDPGGFIHVSPVTWGQNPKTCPAMNYYWNSKVPSNEYRVYREGLEYLLGVAKPFGDAVSDDGSSSRNEVGDENGR